MNKYIFLSLLLFTTNLYAQWSKDPTVNSVVGGGKPLVVVSDGLGGAFIFSDPVSDLLEPHGVFAINKFGVVRFPFQSLNDNNEIGSVSAYGMISDGRNGVYIAFDQSNFVSDLDTVIVLKFDSSGVRLWGKDGLIIADAMKSNIAFGAISTDGANGAVIFWRERSASHDPWELKVQRVDPDKNKVWGENGISIANRITDETMYAEIVDNEIYFSYTAIVDTVTNAETRYIQKINSLGALVWTNPVEINLESELIYDGFGGILTAGVLFNSSSNIYSVTAQRIDKNGLKVWGEEGITVSENATSLSNVSIHTDSNGSYVFVWPSFKNIYAQKLSSSGEKQWNADDILIGDPNGDKLLDIKRGVISDGNLNTIMVWRSLSDVDSLGGNTEIYGQMIDKDGIKQWGDIETLISDQGLFGVPWIDPVIVSDHNGGAIAFWYNFSFSQLYAQNINSQGILGEVLTTSVKDDDPSTIPQNFRLFQNYPNPFNPVTTIEFQIPQSQNVKISIYNLLGQEIERLVDRSMAAGFYSIVWNAAEFASGIYIVAIEAGRFSDKKRLTLIK
ncbi:T9SS type A sorting domain-containing protein [candidate division KSB1 bacterium]|nr:T9SS type A sorting domain-containing protein [candidate division KSB1 bacterium]